METEGTTKFNYARRRNRDNRAELARILLMPSRAEFRRFVQELESTPTRLDTMHLTFRMIYAKLKLDQKKYFKFLTLFKSEEEVAYHFQFDRRSFFCAIACFTDVSKFVDFIMYVNTDIIGGKSCGTTLKSILAGLSKGLGTVFERDLTEKAKTWEITKDPVFTIAHYIEENIFNEHTEEGNDITQRYTIDQTSYMPLIVMTMSFYDRLLEDIFHSTEGRYQLIKQLPPNILKLFTTSLMGEITCDITAENVAMVRENRTELLTQIVGENFCGPSEILHYVINFYELLIGPIIDDLGIAKLIEHVQANLLIAIGNAVKYIEELKSRESIEPMECTEPIEPSDRTALKQQPATPEAENTAPSEPPPAVPQPLPREIDTSILHHLKVLNFMNCVATTEENYLKLVQDTGFKLDCKSGIIIDANINKTEWEHYKMERVHMFVKHLLERPRVLQKYVKHYYHMIAAVLPVKFCEKDDYYGMIDVVNDKYSNFLVDIYAKITINMLISKQPTNTKTIKIRAKWSPLIYSVFNRVFDIYNFPYTTRLDAVMFNMSLINQVMDAVVSITERAQIAFKDDLFHCETIQRKRLIENLTNHNDIYALNSFVEVLYWMVYYDDACDCLVFDKLKKLTSDLDMLADRVMHILILYIQTPRARAVM